MPGICPLLCSYPPSTHFFSPHSLRSLTCPRWTCPTCQRCPTCPRCVENSACRSTAACGERPLVAKRHGGPAAYRRAACRPPRASMHARACPCPLPLQFGMPKFEAPKVEAPAMPKFEMPAKPDLPKVRIGFWCVCVGSGWRWGWCGWVVGWCGVGGWCGWWVVWVGGWVWCGGGGGGGARGAVRLRPFRRPSSMPPNLTLPLPFPAARVSGRPAQGVPAWRQLQDAGNQGVGWCQGLPCLPASLPASVANACGRRRVQKIVTILGVPLLCRAGARGRAQPPDQVHRTQAARIQGTRAQGGC